MTDLAEKYKSVLETIRLYPKQLEQSWSDVSKIDIPESYSSVKNVIVCGMGGSTLGARMVDSLVMDEVKVPIEWFNGYDLPAYANESTLMISSSYSGTTEEAVSCLEKAVKKNLKIVVMTAGGKLQSIAAENGLPSYIMNPTHNPSEQPRMAIGYSVGATLAILSKTGLASTEDDDIKAAMKVMDDSFDELESQVKKLAQKLDQKAAILVASEHLYGVVHTIKNQFNESAKTFSALFELPELNHHLMEGLKNPKSLIKSFHFLFFSSSLYGKQVQKRYPLTMEVIEKNGYEYSNFQPKSGTKLNQLFETLVFGSLVVYHLSKNYEIDPTKIPWVDYFKTKLGQPLGK